ncbi:MAG TPA: exosortase system-associated protein, TIGR04073 family [Candidatus Sulfotelmatobacter sp.]|nr:exosortase system-associated protein, TIGR04073 family [Candidatus Sulfotelmatobacter sp.]
MERKQIIVGLAVLTAALTAAPAFAAEGPDHVGNPGEKLARGVVNITTGWVEVPKETALGVQEAGPPGLIGGLLKGVALGVARTAVGGLEVGTFFLPIPHGYEPILKPATVFDAR